MEPEWTPRFEELGRNIQQAMQSDSEEFVFNVFRELESHKQALQSVLDEPAPNAAHRAQLKLGSPVIGGRVQPVNEQFITDAILLSDQLYIDEYATSSLLEHGIQQQARYDRNAVETSIILYHRERIALLQCLYSLVDTSSYHLSPTPFNKALAPLREELLDPAKGNMASKVLALVSSLDKKSVALKDSMSETSALVAQLGMTINEDRLDYLKQERVLAATVLFGVAFYHELPSTVLKASIEVLKKMTLSDPLSIYLTVTVMSALEISDDHMLIRGKEDLNGLPAFMTQGPFVDEYARLITGGGWAVPAIQATILFQFSLCIGHTQRNKPDDLTEDELQSVAEKAICSDAFQFVADYILGFKSQVAVSGKPFEVPFDISNASLGIVDQTTDGFETTVGKPVAVQLDVCMQDGVLELLEMTLRDFIITMLPLLRKIKHKEEDGAAHQASHRQSQTQAIASRNDLEALFTVIALVYKDRPDAGIRFWPNNDDRSYRFLKWGADSKNTARAFFDMLASLATGSQCAHHAYEFLKSNGGRYGTQNSSAPTTLCSWTKLFEAIEFYTNRLNQDIATGKQVEQIRPEEEALLKSFMRLLAVVAQYSAVARSALNDTKQFRVVHSLFRFFICPISVELKATILDTIAAFATPSAIGSDTASLVWEYLEQARILPKAYIAPPPDPSQSAADKGVVAATAPIQDSEQLDSGIGLDIEEIEAANEAYPETIAFTRLLSSLVQVPLNPDELLSGGSPTIPNQLGSGYRQPGVVPYARFVLDKIFVKAQGRAYRVPSEKWKVLDACLDFMERCLLSFDIGSFVLGDSTKMVQDHSAVEAQKNNALRASLHPGFHVLTRLLAGGDVLTEVLRILANGVDVLNRDDSSVSHLKSSIARCFRILTKTMQLQDVFMEYIVQVLLTTNTKSTLLSSLAPMEQHLAYNNSSIIDIACYINCDVSNEICSLSIEILDRLSASPFFSNGGAHRGVAVNRLVRLLESSRQSKQILYGFVEKLETEDDEEVTEFGAKQVDSDMSMDGQDDQNATQKRGTLAAPKITSSALRLQILRLLLDNLDESRSTPSIAHFLLGYPTESHVVASGPDKADFLANLTSVTALHVTLDLLCRGMDGQDADNGAVPLYITHPQLAEKCQELIFRLCSDIQTSSATMRYLRVQEAFFYRHLRALPTRFDEGLQGDHGVFRRMNGYQFRGDFFKLLAQLYQRSWVMKTSTLELRVACEANQRREALSLLSLLYGTANQASTSTEDSFMFSVSRADSGNLEQPKMKILELLDSLDFSWQDDLKVQDFGRTYYADVVEDSCLEQDEYGIQSFNVRKVFSVLLARKSQLENANAFTNATQKAQAHAEIEAIMEQCLARNHARRLEAGRKNAFEAWRELVEVTLGPGFELLQVDKRELMLYDVLEAVLDKMQGDLHPDITTILSKVTLCVLQRLRMDHFRQFIFQATSTDPSEIDSRLPAERLHRIARSIIGCILRPGTSQSRCNLYSTLVNYFQYTRSEAESHRSMQATPSGVDVSLSRGRGRGRSSGVQEALELGNQVLVAEASERLFEVVCRDASDVDQVCKIAAFTLLNALYGLFEKEVSNRVLTHLIQRNYLKHFIEIMAREDLDLQASVKGRMSRIPIVSETRMTLFLRIAQRRDGAEQLLEYGYFDVLANSSSVIDMRSNLDTSDYGPFEQTESNRYHNVVYPMLQVAVAILSSLGRNHRTAASKAELFISSHQDTFASILRDDDSLATINSLRELRAVTGFMNQLAGHIATKATTVSVFGPLHGLLLALVPKYTSHDQWAQTLQPVSDAERVMANVMAPSLSAKTGTSLFERDARSLAKDICKNLLSYCQISTESGDRSVASSFTPLFTWTISGAASNMDLHSSSPSPSLATMVHFLDRMAAETQDALLRHQTQTLKLSHISSLTPEEKQDILEASDEVYLEDLVAIQRDQLAVQVLQKMLVGSIQEVMSSLYLLETSLVLFWRHLDYYLGQYPGALDGPGSQAGLGVSRYGVQSSFGNTFRSSAGLEGSTKASSFAESARSPPQQQNQLSKNFKPSLTEAQALKRDAGHVIKPVLDSVMSLDLTQDRAGWDNSSRTSFIELLVRRVRGLVERI